MLIATQAAEDGARSASLISAGFRSERVNGFAPWKDFVNANFPWLEHRQKSAGDFHAEVGAYDIAGGALTTISADALEVIRTKALAERAEAGFVKLMWQVSGGLHLEQDGRECLIEAGQATVCDTARPYRIQISDQAHFAVLMLPYDALPGWEGISQRVCGRQLADEVTLRATLAALMSLRGAPDGGSCDTVLKALQWMLTASLHRSATSLGSTSVHNARLNKAQQYILRNIHDPSLDVDNLAAALCMSRRSLYMLFKEYQLTPVKMIHDLRLQRTMQVLGDANQHHRKITDIAFDHGFNDYATFSRLFKAHYGMTPSEYRHKLQEPGSEPDKGS
jgi:AraC family transcriptional activator of tynA and feaB